MCLLWPGLPTNTANNSLKSSSGDFDGAVRDGKFNALSVNVWDRTCFASVFPTL